MRKNIYMNPPLEKLLEETQAGKFSQRLGEVVERYDIILSLAKIPELTEDETMIMSEVICGSAVTPTMIKSMHWSVMDAATGTKELRKILSEKIEQLSPAQRVKLIETMGQ